MYCTNCGYELSGKEAFCTNCGAPVKIHQRRNSHRKNGRNAVVVLLVAVVLGLLLGIGGGTFAYGLMHQGVKIRYCVSEVVYDGGGEKTESRKMEYSENWKEAEQFAVVCYKDGQKEYEEHYSRNFVRREYERKILLNEMQTAYQQNGKVDYQYYEAAENANLGFQKTSVTYGYNSSGLISSYVNMIWDDRGDVRQEDGIVSYKEENGMFVWEDMSDGTGYKYYYDADGTLLLSVDYLENEETTRTEYIYDDYGAEIECREYYRGKLMRKTISDYQTAVVSQKFVERFPMFQQVE